MDKPAPVPTERNPEVHAQHRRETQRHIYIPLIAALVVIFAGVIAIIIYGLRHGSTLHRWASVSLIWVLIPFMFIGVLIMISAIGVMFGVTRVLEVLPGYGDIAQGYVHQATTSVNQVADGMVEPVLRVRSSWAVVKRRSRLVHKQPLDAEGAKDQQQV